jgi:hypothetical protein
MILENAHMQLEVLQTVLVCVVKLKLVPHMVVMPRRGGGLNTSTRVATAKSRIMSIPYDERCLVPLPSLLYIACAGCRLVLLFYSFHSWSSTLPLVERADLHASYSSPPCLGVKSRDRVTIGQQRLA